MYSYIYILRHIYVVRVFTRVYELKMQQDTFRNFQKKILSVDLRKKLLLDWKKRLAVESDTSDGCTKKVYVRIGL